MNDTKTAMQSGFQIPGRTLHKLSWKEIIHQLGAAPNMLSVSRIVFLPFVIFLIKHNMTPWSVIALGVLWVTDLIDGYIARKFRQQTELGLVLDPAADKLTSAALFVTLYLYRDFPLWITAIVLLRDFFILTCALFLIRRSIILGSNFLGRLTTVTISIIILLYVLNLEKLSIGLCYLLMVMMFLTLISYGLRFFRYLSKEKK